MARIRKNDKVIVIAGKDKGKTGIVTKVLPSEEKVVVEGVNVRTRRKKASQGQAGGHEVFEAPIHVSNVQYYDEDSKRGKRLGARVEQAEVGGKLKTVRVRVARGHGEQDKEI